MDIAKRKHYASFVDVRGRVLRETFPVIQSKEGFEQLYGRIRQAMQEFGKTEVIVAIEPTGHYWLNLAYFLEEKGIPLVIVNPAHVRRSKELDDNLPTKHDTKDALVIARLAKDGRFSFPRLLHEIEADLRVGSTLQEKLRKEQAAVLNAIIRWTPVFSGVLHGVPKSRENGAGCAGAHPISGRDHRSYGRGARQSLSTYRQSEGLKSPQKPKIRKPLDIASRSIIVVLCDKLLKVLFSWRNHIHSTLSP